MPSMQPLRTPGHALVAVLAALALGAAIAQAGSADGGLSVTPAVLEHAAVPGPVGSVVLANTTSGSLRITVTPRPWVSSASGAVSPNRRLDLKHMVGVSRSSFTLAAGASQSVTLTLLHKPGGGSLYGSVEAIGVPLGAAKHKGITVGYRLISSLRLDASMAARKLRVKVGSARVQGRNVVLAVRNTGNTVDPIGGSAKVGNALGARNATIAAQRILPGSLVLLTLTPVRGLAPGRYVATFTLMQSGHRVGHGTSAFRVR